VSSDQDWPYRLDPDDVATCIRVLGESEKLDPNHPDAAAIRRATGAIFKTLKKRRREERRNAVADADRAVVHATATGSPNRIDDETV